MRIIITEEQNNKLIEKITNSIKTNGWDSTSKYFGGDSKMMEMLNIDNPSDYLNFMYGDMDIVLNDEDGNYLFRPKSYVPGDRIEMFYEPSTRTLWIDESKVLSPLLQLFKPKGHNIKQGIKDWLGDTHYVSPLDVKTFDW